jgi:hypothetical protein
MSASAVEMVVYEVVFAAGRGKTVAGLAYNDRGPDGFLHQREDSGESLLVTYGG